MDASTDREEKKSVYNTTPPLHFPEYTNTFSKVQDRNLEKGIPNISITDFQSLAGLECCSTFGKKCGNFKNISLRFFKLQSILT